MRNTKKAFTLIEIVLAISVIAILLLAVGTSTGVRENAKVQSAAESVRTLRVAAENYIAGGNSTYTGISVSALKTAGYLPAGFSETGSNSWGGNYAVAVNASNSSQYDISLTSVSTAGCSRLSALFANSCAASSCTSGTWSATF